MAETLKWPRSLKKHNTKRLNAKKRTGSFKILIAGLLTGLPLFFVVHHYSNQNVAIEIFTALSWVSIMAIIIYVHKFFSINIEHDKLQKGLNGELIVAYELDRLPDGWLIINDILIGGSQIDHIAVGPTGIFCLETKNWNNAACDENGIWYRFHLGQWVSLDESPAKQNLKHVLLLRRLLKERLELNKKVSSVIVLANPNGKFNISSRVVPPGNTIVCMPSELHQLLTGNGNTVLLPDEARKVAQNLTGT